MSTIRLHATTTLTPKQYIAGLTDFGPGRSKLFGNSSDEDLRIHHLGLTHADVTEGSRGIWERLHCSAASAKAFWSARSQTRSMHSSDGTMLPGVLTK